MTTIFVFFLFFWNTKGVFGDMVSVMEGDSVTLHTGLTETPDDVFEWKFGGIRIARWNRPGKKLFINETGSFKGRLDLNRQTGDLTISNTRTEDSGEYDIYNINKLQRKFSVTVESADPVKSVMEGDSVTLNTGVKIYDKMDWRFGQQNTLVAQFNKTTGILSTFDGPDLRFRRKLQLDNPTGSLIIKKISSSLSGVYKVSIRHSGVTIERTYTLTVSGKLQSFLLVNKGEPVDLKSGLTEIKRDDVLVWMFGDTVIAEIDKATPRLSESNTERFRNRLGVDHQTGSLTITNTRTNDSGDYELEIRGNKFTISKIFSVSVSELKFVTAGETVTLHTNDIQKDQIEWWFGNELIPTDGLNERWNNTRLEENGDLTITKIQRDQKGDYEVISKNTVIKKFWIEINDEIVFVSVMEGGPVTLNSSVTELQTEYQLKWIFRDSVIMSLSSLQKIIKTTDKRFKDRLVLDVKTGSLTITNTKTEHTGLYNLQINSRKRIINKNFIVTVDARAPPSEDSFGGWRLIAIGLIVFNIAVVIVLLIKFRKSIITCIRKDGDSVKKMENRNRQDDAKTRLKSSSGPNS